jgi:hypothetical protein
MKKGLMILAIISIFLISFAMAGMTTNAVMNNSPGANNQDSDNSGSQIQANTNTANQGVETDLEIQSRIRTRAGNKLTDEQIRKIFTLRNRIKNQYMNQSDCPRNCTCTGSTARCQLRNGTREMTIAAGSSGNMMIQVRGVDASTSVVLYKAENGKVYAINKNNETVEIRMLPDQVQERIRERITARIENENITLNEDGNYTYQAKKRARLFFIFPVRVAVQAEINSETGEVTRTRNSWWAFLARDEAEEPLLGASCGTVTPGQNNACCQNKGYDVWNAETGECGFSDSE